MAGRDENLIFEFKDYILLVMKKTILGEWLGLMMMTKKNYWFLKSLNVLKIETAEPVRGAKRLRGLGLG
jgi:hypothetical protein